MKEIFLYGLPTPAIDHGLQFFERDIIIFEKSIRCTTQGETISTSKRSNICSRRNASWRSSPCSRHPSLSSSISTVHRLEKHVRRSHGCHESPAGEQGGCARAHTHVQMSYLGTMRCDTDSNQSYPKKYVASKIIAISEKRKRKKKKSTNYTFHVHAKRKDMR